MTVQALDVERQRRQRKVIKSDEFLPNGFCGPVRTWSELLPPAERSLRLPRDLPQVAPGLHCQQPIEPSLQFDLIEVQAVTESMGRVEDAVRALALRLADGGTLVLEFEHLQALPRLRAVVEGRPGAFDPIGSIDDPAQALPLKRVLAAVAMAGLHTLDVVAVPTPPGELAADFADTIFRAGLLPMQWLGGPPPARYWLVCRKQKALAGTVLIGCGDDRS